MREGVGERDDWFDREVEIFFAGFINSTMSKGIIKPPSLPNHWPKPSVEDLQANPRRLINVGAGVEQMFSFRRNFVTTSKYTLYNFTALFCLEEFNPRTKVANCYFLLIAMLQCIPQISNTHGYPTTLFPLLIVVLVDGIFQGIEDYSRHKADASANASLTHRYDHAKRAFIDVQWHELEVGDFVQIHNRTTLPADIVALCVAEKGEIATGVCYVENKSLDGETNLKIRNALACTYNKVCIQETNKIKLSVVPSQHLPPEHHYLISILSYSD